jgi:hypothetical protein
MIDTKLLAMQERWHYLKKVWVEAGCPASGGQLAAFHRHDRELSDYLWNKAKADRDEDRRKHPRAKRNQAPDLQVLQGLGRAIP